MWDIRIHRVTLGRQWKFLKTEINLIYSRKKLGHWKWWSLKIMFFFAQSWPSWAFALKILECKELFEVVEWENRLKIGV